MNIKTRTPRLLTQQQFSFGNGVSIALAFFFKNAEYFTENPDATITGVTAKASKLLTNGLEEREILLGIAGGGSGKVTLQRRAEFSWGDEQTTNQWWIASAWVHTPKLGQINW